MFLHADERFQPLQSCRYRKLEDDIPDTIDNADDRLDH